MPDSLRAGLIGCADVPYEHPRRVRQQHGRQHRGGVRRTAPGCPVLPALTDDNSKESRDHPRLFVAIAGVSSGHLAQHPDAFTISSRATGNGVTVHPTIAVEGTL